MCEIKREKPKNKESNLFKQMSYGTMNVQLQMIRCDQFEIISKNTRKETGLKYKGTRNASKVYCKKRISIVGSKIGLFKRKRVPKRKVHCIKKIEKFFKEVQRAKDYKRVPKVIYKQVVEAPCLEMTE